jgi:nucleoside-diphosphate-sugar epimerase
MDRTTVLITGANGFLGSALLDRCAREPSMAVRAAIRKPCSAHGTDGETVIIGDLGPATDWRAAVRGVGVVVHTAARVHIMRDTVRLARQAAAAGVRRFIFLSTIKVNGESTRPGKPFTAVDVPAPVDAYGQAKLEAEVALRAIGSETGMEIVTIRPVLIYGPGVKANMRSMMRLIQRGVPLPFGAVDNRRSLVAVDNIVDLIVRCVDHPNAANRVFLVSDDEDVSTTALLRRTARALGKPARLVPVPSWLMSAGATMLGRHDLARRLLGSLQVDIAETRRLLGWAPIVGLDEALSRTAASLRAERRHG